MRVGLYGSLHRPNAFDLTRPEQLKKLPFSGSGLVITYRRVSAPEQRHAPGLKLRLLIRVKGAA
jgi:hypothetical protein